MRTQAPQTSTYSYLFYVLLTIFGIAGILSSCSDEGPGQASVEITGISPDSGAVGTTVRLTARGVDPQAEDNHISFNGIPAEVQSVSANSLTVTVPEKATSGPVSFQVAGHTAKGPYFKVLTRGPVIQSVTPGKGGPGAQVTITGKHFLPATGFQAGSNDTARLMDTRSHAALPPTRSDSLGDKSIKLAEGPQKTARGSGTSISVQFGEKQAPLISLSDTKIIVNVPEKATNGTIKVTVGDKSATTHQFHLLMAPAIQEVSPKKGPSGTTVTITGAHFSASSDSNTVTFNGTKATVKSATPTKLVATVPPKATTGNIKVTANKQVTTGPTFTVTDKPIPQVKVDNISPKSGPIGTSVTITGQNFSQDKSDNTVTFNGEEATISSASKTELKVKVPGGATSGPVKVQTGGQEATGPSFNVTADPNKKLTIKNLSPKKGPKGTEVTIKGTNFNSKKNKNTVTFNGTKATIQDASTTVLKVKVPGGATTGTVKIQVGNQTADGPTFTVTDAPVPQVKISGMNPKQGPVGTEVTITGQNFAKNKSDNTVTFNGEEATISSATKTELKVKVPSGATSGPVKVQVGNQTATGPNFNVEENRAPEITGDASFTVDENTATVGTVKAEDPNDGELTFSISGGDDQIWFKINSDSGELKFQSAPDYEKPIDANLDNIYELTVEVSDGELIDTKDISVTVENVVEAPEFFRGRIWTSGQTAYYAYKPDFIFEPVPAGTDLSNIIHFDISMYEDNDPLKSVSLGGRDEADFSVAQTDNYTIFLKGPTLDYSRHADHAYVFDVTAENDAGQTTTQTFTIPVEAPSFAGGSGTASNPYQVATLQQLQQVGQNLGSHFIQTNHIDASATSGWNDGSGFDPIGDGQNNFHGSYDGNGYTIANLTIDRPNQQWVGLFGHVGSGEIKSVQLTNVDVTGHYDIGGLAGENDGTITKSYSTGNVSGPYEIGGLVGENSDNGMIKYSYSAATVNSGGEAAGGLVGQQNGTISNSYATGAVSGQYSVGGLVGAYYSGTITSCYAAGSVTVSTNVDNGGLIGRNDSGPIPTNSYWDTVASGQSSSNGGTGLTTSQMQGSAAQTHMTGFDFSGVWETVSGDYPILRGVGGQ